MLKDLEKAEQKAFIDESLKQEHEVCMDDDDSNDISRGMTSPDALAAPTKNAATPLRFKAWEQEKERME